MSTSKAILGTLAGLAAGAAIGILLAPRSGKETRQMIREKSREAKDDLGHLLDQGFEQWKKVRKTAVERASMTKQDIQDFLRFMAGEGADLKERVMGGDKGTADKVRAN